MRKAQACAGRPFCQGRWRLWKSYLLLQHNPSLKCSFAERKACAAAGPPSSGAGAPQAFYHALWATNPARPRKP